MHVYKSFLNVLVELRPKPGLILTLYVKPGLNVSFSKTTKLQL